MWSCALNIEVRPLNGFVGSFPERLLVRTLTSTSLVLAIHEFGQAHFRDHTIHVSWISSLPSRVRSQTTKNTPSPLCVNVLWISFMMNFQAKAVLFSIGPSSSMMLMMQRNIIARPTRLAPPAVQAQIVSGFSWCHGIETTPGCLQTKRHWIERFVFIQTNGTVNTTRSLIFSCNWCTFSAVSFVAMFLVHIPLRPSSAFTILSRPLSTPTEIKPLAPWL